MPAQFTGSEEWGAVRSVEFFTAHSRNPHKRKAYAKAAAEFAPWCDEHGVHQLDQVQPIVEIRSSAYCC